MTNKERQHKQELGRTVCASCERGKLAKVEMWQGTAWRWVCEECGHTNRWIYKELR